MLFHAEHFLDTVGDYLEHARRQAARQGLDAIAEAASDLKPGDDADAWTRRLTALVYALLEERANRLPDPFDAQKLYDTPESQALLSFLVRAGRESQRYPPEHLHEEMRTSYSLNYHVQAHLRAGRRVFEVDPNLAAKLDATELRGLSTDDLRLPFRAIGICVPASVGLVVTNRQTGEHRVDSIYVAEDTAIAGERYWHLLVCGERKADALDDALFHFGVRLPADTPLDKALDEQERLTLGRIEQRASIESTELYRRAWRRIFRWVMNVVIYATSAEARTVSFTANKEARQLEDRIRKLPVGGKRDGLKERLRGLDARRRTILGPNEPPMQVSTTRDGRGLAVRTLVSGHWRRQPHGPRHTLRKTIWIKPFWRGDDLLDESIARRILR